MSSEMMLAATPSAHHRPRPIPMIPVTAAMTLFQSANIISASA
jgi:hypothetical protein